MLVIGFFSSSMQPACFGGAEKRPVRGATKKPGSFPELEVTRT